MSLTDFVLFLHLLSMGSGYGFCFSMGRTLSFSNYSIIKLKQPSCNGLEQESTYTAKKKKKNLLRKKFNWNSLAVNFSMEVVFIYELIGFQW